MLFFNDTAATEIYYLSLHDALPISPPPRWSNVGRSAPTHTSSMPPVPNVILAMPGRTQLWPTSEACWSPAMPRSEEHTSELQSRQYLACRLLLEKNEKCDVRVCARV